MTNNLLYTQFLALLDAGEKAAAVDYCLKHLDDNTLDIVTLYQNILTPALNEPSYGSGEEDVNIWEEHIRTSIVRTIIESCYTRVIKERDEKYGPVDGRKALVLCPSDEAHEVGARMVADFFLLCGFDVTFIGSSTPGAEIIDAISYFKPDYVAVSVTNAYNLMAVSKSIKSILDLKALQPFTLVLGGRACKVNPQTCSQLKADVILDTFDDIRRLSTGETDAAV